MGLTSSGLFWTMVIATIALPFLTVLLWVRTRGRHPWIRAGAGLGMVFLSQIAAVVACSLYINNLYGFYTSWGDFAGHPVKPTAITVNGLGHQGQGTLRAITVHGKVATEQALVWLPPGYHKEAAAHHKLPVVMFMTGQPSSPAIAYKEFEFGAIATREIKSGRIKPFVGVFPPLMVRPPRDTECTNIPHGPRAENWLAYDVPNAIIHHFSVDPTGKKWSLMGWSTGGFCAAKLVIAHSTRFAAAVGFGAYYQPLEDHTTGNLFHGKAKVRELNSPQWLYLRHGMLGNHLLMISGRQDRQSWPSTRKMIRATQGDPNVSYVDFPTGGHNYTNYRAYLGPAFDWLKKVGAAE